MPHFIYKLDGRRPVPATLDEVRDLVDGTLESSKKRRVAETRLRVKGRREVYVSTVFLVFNLYPFGEPRLFETMIFDFDPESDSLGKAWDYQDRSVTWEDAEEAHALAVEHVYSRAPWAVRI